MSRSAVILIFGSLLSVGSGMWFLDSHSMPISVTKAVGDTVYLGPTKPPDRAIHTFKWSFQEIPIAGSYSGEGYNASNVDRVRLHHQNLTLEIRELGLNDTGTYMLYVVYIDGTFDIRETYMHVLEGGHGGGLTSGAIAGIVCGLLFAVALCVGLVLLAMFKLPKVWVPPRLDGMRLSDLTPKAAL